jgi:radical SAM superfamily enzyme YgiQ (UPF0313 family)
MLVLVNPNRLTPPIAPIGLDYVASAAKAAGIPTRVVDLGLVEGDKISALAAFETLSPRLVGVSLRNLDDCFWPSATSYLEQYVDLLTQLRQLTDAPIVVGGVGFSIFGQRLLSVLGADFGVRGDGERAIIELYRALEEPERWPGVPGLIWSSAGRWLSNPSDATRRLTASRLREHVDNRAYFRLGGQLGIETKRGCPRRCIYCADPVAKGKVVRCRSPESVADEFELLRRQGIDVVHICDGEFNVPGAHAMAVCDALIRRNMAERMRFYTYMAVRPFDLQLARAMKRAGCVGINFTGDSASDAMLLRYRAAHRRSHLSDAVALCRTVGITCMVDLLLGGPGETLESVKDTVDFIKWSNPDCVGAALGMRLYPETLASQMLDRDGTLQSGAGIRRRYVGPIDLLQPTFYISPAMGSQPARLVRELIAGDHRFFPPVEEVERVGAADDHNYSDNRELAQAIARGARGAYWDILRQMR